MDKELGGGGTLRSRAMSEIERVRFIPEKGPLPIGSMVEGRPDWVLSASAPGAYRSRCS